jgi:hypothetical protein
MDSNTRYTVRENQEEGHGTMNDTYITRQEHEEFRRRLDDENTRQNRRIELLEENVLEIGQLTTTVAKMAVNLDNVIAMQKKQGERLDVLESRDGDRWRSVTRYLITAVIGIIVGYIFTQFGM